MSLKSCYLGLLFSLAEPLWYTKTSTCMLLPGGSITAAILLGMSKPLHWALVYIRWLEKRSIHGYFVVGIFWWEKLTVSGLRIGRFYGSLRSMESLSAVESLWYVDSLRYPWTTHTEGWLHSAKFNQELLGSINIVRFGRYEVRRGCTPLP